MSSFDRRRLVEQLGSEEIVEELMVMFINSITQHLEELREALAVGQLKAAQRAVHNIKGISGAIYCRSLHQHATIVDQLLKEEVIDAEAIAHMRRAAETFLAELKQG